MHPTNILLGLSNIFIGALVIGLCIPLLKDKIKMNHWYGIRWFKKSFESDENWYKINRYGGRRMIIWSMVLIAIGVVAFFLPVSGTGTILLASAPMIYVIPAVECWQFTK